MKKMKIGLFLLLGLFTRFSFAAVAQDLYSIKRPFAVVDSSVGIKRVPIKSDIPENVVFVSVQKEGYAKNYGFIGGFAKNFIDIENKKYNTNKRRKVVVKFVAIEYKPEKKGIVKKTESFVRPVEALEVFLRKYLADDNTKVILLTGGSAANVVSLVTEKIQKGSIGAIIYLDPLLKKGNIPNLNKVEKIYNFYTKDKNKQNQFAKNDKKAFCGKDIIYSNIFMSFIDKGLKKINLDRNISEKSFSDKKNYVFMENFFKVAPELIYLTDTYYKLFKGSLSGVFSKSSGPFLFLKSEVIEKWGTSGTNAFVEVSDGDKKQFGISFKNQKAKDDYNHQSSWESAFSVVSFENMKSSFNLKTKDLKKLSFLSGLTFRKLDQQVDLVNSLKKWEEDWKFYPPKKVLNQSREIYRKIRDIRRVKNKKFLFLRKMKGDDIAGIIPFNFKKYPFIAALTGPIGKQPFVEGPYLDFLKFARKHGDKNFEPLIKDGFQWLVDLEKSEYSADILEELKMLRTLVFYAFSTIPASVDTLKLEEPKIQIIKLAGKIASFCKELKTKL